MKTYRLLGIIFIISVFTSCYKDLGNYDYREINEVSIGDPGFADTTYILKSFVDTLRIFPEIAGSQSSGGDNYEYKWVAVGDRFRQGGTWVLSEEKDLIYPLNLPEQMYTVYLHVKDKTTGLVTTRYVPVSLKTVFSQGWLLWGVNDREEAQLDMVALIGKDTTVMKDILRESSLPVLKDPTFLFVPSYMPWGDANIQIGTADGSYKIDPEKLVPLEDAHLKYSFFDISSAGPCVLERGSQQSGFRVEIIDGNLYYDNDRMGGYSKFGNPSNHYKGKYELFNMGTEVGFNMNYSWSVPTAIVAYDKDSRRFVSQGKDRNSVGFCDSLIDRTASDPFSWKTGLDFVTTINSRKAGVTCYTILKTPGAATPADYYLYGYNIASSGLSVSFEKKFRMQLTKAIEINRAKFFVSSVQNSVIFYVAGNKLYGYNYYTGKMKEVLNFDNTPVKEVITALWYNDDTYADNADEFYLALYDPQKPASSGGRIVGYRVEDNPDDIVIEEIPGSSVGGLCKVVSMSIKSE